MPWVEDESTGDWQHFYGKDMCYACGFELKPVFDDASTKYHDQYLDALEVKFSGGYGMLVDPYYFDDEDTPHVIVCRSCALQLMNAVPWVERLLKHQLTEEAS